MATAPTESQARLRRGLDGKEPMYTSDHTHNVNRILGCKTHYEVLCIDAKCTDEDIKKSYKRLALDVHPDRNRHPDAKRAFEAIKKASDVLSDVAQRRRYDDEINAQVLEALHQFFKKAQAAQEQARRSRGWNEESRDEEDTPAPDFSPRPTPPPSYTSRTYNSGADGRSQYQLMGVFTIIAFFVILYLAISLSIGDQSYSFLKTGEYQLPRKTSGLKVPFYIKKSSEVNIGRSFENNVERDYLSQLKVNCDLETRYKSNTGFKHLTTPSCGLYRRQWRGV